MSPGVQRCDLSCSQLFSSLVGCNNTTSIPSTSQCENWLMSIFWSVNVMWHVRYKCQARMYLWFNRNGKCKHDILVTELQRYKTGSVHYRREWEWVENNLLLNLSRTEWRILGKSRQRHKPVCASVQLRCSRWTDLGSWNSASKTTCQCLHTSPPWCRKSTEMDLLLTETADGSILEPDSCFCVRPRTERLHSEWFKPSTSICCRSTPLQSSFTPSSVERRPQSFIT